MLPTFLPGGVSRPTVVGFPACLCLPPPWGWDAAIIAWPLTTGHFRPRDFCRNHLGPAFKKGFSVRPAPATTPIIARHLSYRETLLESWPQMVPTKVPRTEMAGSQRPSNDRSVPPPRWWKTQTRREAYDCRSRYTSWKKSRQHRGSRDRPGKASLGAIDPRNILILQVESNMTQYG